MPEIEIRPAIAADIPILASLEHHYSTEYTWQLDIQPEDGGFTIDFREVRLPRLVHVDTPRSPSRLTGDWEERDGLLTALLNDLPVAYISLALDIAPLTTWVTDLVVSQTVRRKGVGSGLLLAAQEWGLQQGSLRLVLEMQTKNYPAMQMARKLGFNFCGYNDHYYVDQGIGLFFMRSIR